jgi:hypothetical protein
MTGDDETFASQPVRLGQIAALYRDFDLLA